MYRRGHTGIVLLALTPVLYILLEVGRPFLAVLACDVIVIEPLPDYDLRTRWLSHRGMSHTVVSAGVVGVCCAGLGWVLGTYVTVPFTAWVSTAILPLFEIPALVWVVGRLGALDAAYLSVVGGCVGMSGICLHLLGDIITVSGIRPFLPFSRRQVSLSSLRAANSLANSGLFVLGVVAISTVGVVSTPVGGWLLALLGIL